jgi:hypothetical protein
VVGLCCLSAASVRAADASKLDSEGYIRDWLMLAPIALPDGESGSDALFREQIKDEAALRPKAGDKVTIRGKELAWQNTTATTNYFDFNAVLKTINDHAAGYAVLIECETEKPDVIMAVAGNDEGRIYFNGVDIYAQRTAHADARHRQGQGDFEEGPQRDRVQSYQRAEQLAGRDAVAR